MPTRRPLKQATQPEPMPGSGEKIIQTYRLPVSLVAFLKKEAEERGIDLTALVNRILDAHRTYGGLPMAAAEILEDDRQALKLDRLEYFLHVLYRRSEVVQAQRPGFDNPSRRESIATKKPR